VRNILVQTHTSKRRIFSFEAGRKHTNVQGAAFNLAGKRNSVDSDLISEAMDA
jgi:hypothetical protein